MQDESNLSQAEVINAKETKISELQDQLRTTAAQNELQAQSIRQDNESRIKELESEHEAKL